MARGGARQGAGRKPGSATKRTREIAERAIAERKSPLEVLLDIMHEATDTATKLEAAKAAAPYVHPKLSSIEAQHSGPGGGPINTVTRIELVALTDGNSEDRDP
ncbi:hypothetical protein [Azospirillum picis]|uniref:Uncharacterized protein n=1 Tax=Azospirillum picis TaxID=488438 RepID=A0ABU0MPJ6_9PROT|nr:hypothetical protein [Azospirillum picis]MBP2301563.1 hypothetical protein [Azospirillum picis]MDQ0535395.1 hypothetical protein [Azospirillum picis]